jgi:hypothetical protein
MLLLGGKHMHYHRALRGRVTVRSLPIVLVIVAASTAATATAPSMTVSWLDTKLSKEDCVTLGEKSMRAAEMTKAFEVLGGSTVYGESGDYTGAIRCVESHELVMFITAGPDSDKTDEFNKKIKVPFNAPSSN